ncbi:MAG: hypothetical protein QW746_04895, partial [Thermoplasmata archaeon]
MDSASSPKSVASKNIEPSLLPGNIGLKDGIWSFPICWKSTNPTVINSHAKELVKVTLFTVQSEPNFL